MVDEPVNDRRLEALVQRGVNILDTTVLQTFLCHLAVETADIPRGQLLELAPPEFGDDVVVNIPSVGSRATYDGGSFTLSASHQVRYPSTVRLAGPGSTPLSASAMAMLSLRQHSVLVLAETQ